jgi:nucleoid-associated protein YgaU/DNA-binding SARP family transcriptional activator
MVRRARALAALATLAVVTVGVPALLVAVAGWPLPRKWPDWDRVRVALQQGDIPAEVVVKTIAILVWIGWAQLMWSLAWELVVNMRATERGVRARPTPLAPRLMSSAVTRLVAIAFSVGVSTLTTASTALASTAVSPVVSAPFTPRTPPTGGVEADRTEASAVAAECRWRVAEGDSLWSISERSLGDGSRVTEVLELNRWLQSARDLHPGQVIMLPFDAQIPADRVPEADVIEPVTEPSVEAYAPAEEIEVVSGDNLWNLADARLERAMGESPAGADVLDYVNAVIAANQTAINDPDLIYPGQRLVLPAVGTPPPPSAPPPAETVDPPAPPPVESAPITPSAATTVADTTAAPTSAPLSLPSVAAAVPAVSTTPPTTERAVPASGAGVRQVNAARDSSPDRAPVIVGVSGATALATGLLLVFRRLRRRQTAASARAARQRPVPERVASTERALVAAADVTLMDWAAEELRAVMRNSSVASGVEGVPLVVELSTEQGIEVLWSVANRTAPHPWLATADGWTWHLPYDPARRVPVEPTTAQLPGLVTIGQREGRQVLIDLEAFGSISVTGDLRRAEDFVRAIAMELATAYSVSNAFIHAVGLQLPAIEHLGRVTERDVAWATTDVAGVVRAYRSLLIEAKLSDTFRLRALHGAEGRELTVLMAGSGVSDAQMAGALATLKPHHGAAAVVIGEHAGAQATIEIDQDGCAVLRPVGLEFQAAGLPSASADLVEAAIDDAAETLAPSAEAEAWIPIEPLTLLDEPAPVTSGDGHANDDWQPPTTGLLVRVLGAPRVEGVDGLPATDVSLVAFLACHGRMAAEDQLINAVWNGRAVNKATLWNHITKARSVLGAHIPPRKPGDAVRLGDEVTTDLAILEACAKHAREAASGRAIELLEHGLALIEGPPFDLPGYDWAFEHQYHAEASAAIEAAALQLVGLALQAGHLDVARRAIGQGLRALPANEPLYRERMKLEAHAGNHTAVRQAFAELRNQLDELGGGTAAFDPSPETLALAKRLTTA